MHSSTSPENVDIFNNEGQEWQTWARNLRRLGLAGLTSALLESSGAFSLLAAQGLYIGQPMLEPWLPVRKLAALLDDPQQAQAFAKLLREESG